jgi:hypothetical protein
VPLCAPWTTVEEVQTCPPYDVLSPEAVEWAVDAASDALYRASGEQFGGPCTETIRPETCAGGCGGSRFLTLGVSPITAVSRVTVAGVDLDPSLYVIVDGLYLARTDQQVWPCVSDTVYEPPRLEVVATYGVAPPPMGRLAAQVLAGELARSRCGSEDCQLDRRVRTITRQQVTMDLAVPGIVDALREGRTGISEVDLFVFLTNPAGLQRSASLVLPGRTAVRRISG